jgi:hypothetical protein
MRFYHYENDHKNLQALVYKWKQLPRKTKDAILILSGVVKLPRKDRWRTYGKRGEGEQWLLPALNLLKDGEGRMPDRAIAEQIGISPSTLSRSAAYQRAKKAYLHERRTK